MMVIDTCNFLFRPLGHTSYNLMLLKVVNQKLRMLLHPCGLALEDDVDMSRVLRTYIKLSGHMKKQHHLHMLFSTRLRSLGHKVGYHIFGVAYSILFCSEIR